MSISVINAVTFSTWQSEVSTESGSDRVSCSRSWIVRSVVTRSLPLPVLTSSPGDHQTQIERRPARLLTNGFLAYHSDPKGLRTKLINETNKPPLQLLCGNFSHGPLRNNGAESGVYSTLSQACTERFA